MTSPARLSFSSSPGGAVVAGLALGRAFRRLNMTVTVGQTVMLPADASGEQRASYSPKALCASMCPFVLLGGVRRHVPPEARILVHQIWPGAQRADSTAAIYAAQQVAGLLRSTSEIARYTVDMGGEIELFDLSMRISAVGGAACPDQHRGTAYAPEYDRYAVRVAGGRCGVFAAAGRAAADRRPARVLPALDLGRCRRRPQRGAAASAELAKEKRSVPSWSLSPAARSR